MNWAAFSFDWNQIRTFLATVEAGTLSGAARRLGSTQPTVGRQVDRLEQDLGVVLFERSARGLALTQAGLELVEHVRVMADAAARVSLSASGQAQAIEGQVTITASDSVSVCFMPPILRRLRDLEPGITVELLASNSVSDLQRREADIAVRHVRPDQRDLMAKLLRTASANLYATGEYLDRIGRPEKVEDLAGADFVGFQSIAMMVEELNRHGLPVRASNFRAMSNSSLAGWEMVKQGLGIGAMMDDIARLSPELEPACPAFEPIEFPIWLVTHRELQTSRRIRLVFDFLAKELRQVFGSTAGAPP